MKIKPDQKVIKEALQRLRQLSSNLPSVDAVAIIRDMRESGLRIS